MAGDTHITEVSGEALPDHILRILARQRYQIRMTISSITAAAIVINRIDGEYAVQLSGSEDVGVFFGGIAPFFQGRIFCSGGRGSDESTVGELVALRTLLY